jgi:hypothetical protein
LKGGFSARRGEKAVPANNATQICRKLKKLFT